MSKGSMEMRVSAVNCYMMRYSLRKRTVCFILAIMVLTLLTPADVLAGKRDGYIIRGVGRTLFSTVEIPKAMIQDSSQIMFPLGLVTGVIKGTFKTVAGTLMGVGDIAYGALPYAKYMIFLV